MVIQEEQHTEPASFMGERFCLSTIVCHRLLDLEVVCKLQNSFTSRLKHNGRTVRLKTNLKSLKILISPHGRWNILSERTIIILTFSKWSRTAAGIKMAAVHHCYIKAKSKILYRGFLADKGKTITTKSLNTKSKTFSIKRWALLNTQKLKVKKALRSK